MKPYIKFPRNVTALIKRERELSLRYYAFDFPCKVPSNDAWKIDI